MSETYQHTQRAPMCLVLYATAVGMLVLAWVLPGPPTISYVLVATAVVFVIIGMGFHHLVVKDEGDELRIQFGPLPLFATRIRYNEITSFMRDRTTIMDGWGIHKSFRGGWVWNIWGRDCVLIEHGGTTRVGTDDAENLMAFLRSRTKIDVS